MTTTPIRPEVTAGEQPAVTAARPWLALFAVLAGSFLHTFDMMVVSVAVPSIRDDLGASAATGQWLLAGYTLPFALLLITGGRLGDALGRRRMVLLGSISFTLASALCAVSTDSAMLIAGRIWQGASAAALTPQVLPVIVLLFPGPRRGAALGAQAGVIALATVSGPVLGGLLTAANIGGVGWRAIFLLNLPVGLFTVIAVLRWLPRGDTFGKRPRLDVGSVLMATLGLLLLVLPLVQGREQGWPLWTFVALAASVPVLVLTIRRQRTREFPLIALSLFRQRSFVAGGFANFLLIGGVASFFLVFVIYLQSGLGFSPARVGLTTASWALAAAVASGATVPLARKVGRPMLVAGALLMAASMAALLAVVLLQGGSLTAGAVAGCLALAGIGQGMLSPPLYDLTLTDVPRKDVGSASGVFGMLTQVGSALGVAVIGVLFFGVLTAAGTPSGCAGAGPLTDGTRSIVDRCAGSAEPARQFVQDAYRTAVAWTLLYQLVCFTAVALLLWRFLPRYSASRRH